MVSNQIPLVTVTLRFFYFLLTGRVVSNFIMQALEGKPLTVSNLQTVRQAGLTSVRGRVRGFVRPCRRNDFGRVGETTSM